MTEHAAAASWRWASAAAQRQFRSRARSMGTYQPFPLETRRRYREHVLSVIQELIRYPDAAPSTSDRIHRAKTIVTPGTAQGDVIVYRLVAGDIIVDGVFASLPAGFLGS